MFVTSRVLSPGRGGEVMVGLPGKQKLCLKGQGDIYYN